MDGDDFLGDSAALLAGKKVAAAWKRLADALAANPDVWVGVANEAQKKQAEMAAQINSPPPATDKRFAAEQWRNPFFFFLSQNYLLGGEALREIIARADISAADKKLLDFAAAQYISAASPSNFPLTNPEVLDDAVKTGGKNFAEGMKNFTADMQSGAVNNVDKTAFALGENVACTPGKVIFQNDIMQLLEYAPQTARVFQRPLLIVPPCINKYYILDLQAQNSFVRHAVAAGHRVFLISWVNASAPHRNLGWDFYLREGVMAAMETARAVSGQAKINALGFCIGGTMLAVALAVLAREKEFPAQSMTLLAAMLDFSEAGDIGMFIDEEYVAALEKRCANGGLADGGELARGFSALRPNDLIWPYFINNYYRGQKPQAFDLLFWNADSTNLPGPMFAEYVRATYLENRIAKNKAEFCGAPARLSAVKIPAYAVACKKDHIVPWTAAFDSARLLGGKTRFVLAASGHIAGIVNPPAAKKGRHQAAPLGGIKNAEEWRAAAQSAEGGWWDDWLEWLRPHSGRQIAAPKKQGNARYAPREDAPGEYVRAPRFLETTENAT
ncbi:MAG: PHA/PHB synthase family protein [Gammaproteobacteria bacterium]